MYRLLRVCLLVALFASVVTWTGGAPGVAAQGNGSEGATPIADPRVDPEGTLIDAFMVALTTAPVAGPKSGNGDLGPGEFKYLSSGVQLSDFYADLYFITPPATPADTWYLGFTFWYDGQGNYYDLVIRAKNSAAEWVIGQSTGGSYRPIQSGALAPGAVDFAPGAENEISIVVYQGVAILSGNEAVLDATYDLGATTGIGDVEAEAGFQPEVGSTTRTLPMSISDFTVWDLSSGVVGDIFSVLTPEPQTEPTQAVIAQTPIPDQPITPPLRPTVAVTTVAPTPAGNGTNALVMQIFASEKSAAMAGQPLFSSAPGEITQLLDSFSFVSSGTSVADFYATATFTNPTDLSVPSDYGIGFRDLNVNQEFRFVVRTDGAWGLSVGTETPFFSGTLTNVNVTPGGVNTLEVVAKGPIGILAVNGQVIQQVDLSGNLNAGDVYIGSGAYAGSTIDQRVVPYSNFAVYQLAS